MHSWWSVIKNEEKHCSQNWDKNPYPPNFKRGDLFIGNSCARIRSGNRGMIMEQLKQERAVTHESLHTTQICCQFRYRAVVPLVK